MPYTHEESQVKICESISSGFSLLNLQLLFKHLDIPTHYALQGTEYDQYSTNGWDRQPRRQQNFKPKSLQ